MNENDEKESFYRDTIEDMGTEKYQLEDPMTFWNTEKKTLWKKILGRTETPFVILGIGLLLVIVIFFAIYPRGESQNALPDSGAISERLQQIEEKIAGMETTLQGAIALQQDMEPVKKAVLRLDTTDASISTRLDGMDKILTSLEKEMLEIKKKTSADTKTQAAPTQAKTEKTTSQTVYYEVQKGDTLYGISRRYGVGVDTIRKLNGLSDQDAIQPGQKLKVKE